MPTPEVKADVRIVPAKRTATYDVELGPAPAGSGPRYGPPKLAARVNAKTITFGASSDIPKTLAAVDAIIALAQAVRAELVEQGIEE